MNEQPQSKVPVELQSGESLLRICRRHWLYFSLRLLWQALVAIVPPIVLLLIVGNTAGLDGITGTVTWIVAAAWFVFWAIKLYFTWYKYNNDMWIITNQRLLDSIKPNWFSHKVSSADLVNIADISVDKSGIFARMFDFGDVRCQTAGQNNSFVLSGIPEPSKVLTLIDSARDASRRDFNSMPPRV